MHAAFPWQWHLQIKFAKIWRGLSFKMTQELATPTNVPGRMPPITQMAVDSDHTVLHFHSLNSVTNAAYQIACKNCNFFQS